MLPVRKFIKGRGGKWHDGIDYSKKGLQQAITRRLMMEGIKNDPVGGFNKFHNFLDNTPTIKAADKERFINEAIEMMQLGKGGVIRGKYLRKNKNKR